MIKDSKKTLNDLLVARIQSVYSGKPWYGKPFNELIKDVDLENSEIQQLVLHIIAWREYAIDLFGGGRPVIEMNSTNDWPKEWQSKEVVLRKLEETQKLMETAVASFDSKNWDELVWHREYSFYYLACGVIDHDIYHIGQVVLMHKHS